MRDKKPGFLSIILAGKHKDGEEEMDSHESDDKEEHDEEEMKRSAMGDFISAIHDKDIDGALSAYDDLCQMPHGEEEEY